MPRKSTKKTAKASKKKLENLNQAHGKDESKIVPTTLEQVWGDDGLWKYKTRDASEYTDSIKAMTWVDLQAHATRHGLIPTGSRPALEKKLINEFKKHMSSYNVSATEKKAAPGEISNNARRILEEGR
tara:strand:- start:2106 stop:2489 length:384 start_codon:yes stop_codon:yes gene_type:complete